MSQELNIREKLISNSQSAYGESYREHCLEIYKTYLGMAEKISDRRQAANSFFLTLNTFTVGGWAYLQQREGSYGWHDEIVLFAALGICFTWFRLIRSYKDLNTAKFKVLHEIEKELPLSPLDAEWEAVGRGNDKTLYLPFTNVEPLVPLVFGLLYVALFFASLWTQFCGLD